MKKCLYVILFLIISINLYAESLPETGSGNTFTSAGTNRPPDAPTGLSIDSTAEGESRLSWKPVMDPENRAVKYHVYAVRGSELELIGITNWEGFTVRANLEFDSLTVTAVDRMGVESRAAEFITALGELTDGPFPEEPAAPPVGDVDEDTAREVGRISLSIGGGIAYPMGSFADLTGTGYGGSLRITRHNIFTDGLEAGISAGFYYITGKENISPEIDSTERAFLVPISLNIGYRIILTEKISLTPFISGGAAYLDIPYIEYDDQDPPGMIDQEMKDYGPSGGGGVLLSYLVTESFELSLKADFNIMPSMDNKSDFKFGTVQLCTSYRM